MSAIRDIFTSYVLPFVTSHMPGVVAGVAVMTILILADRFPDVRPLQWAVQALLGMHQAIAALLAMAILMVGAIVAVSAMKVPRDIFVSIGIPAAYYTVVNIITFLAVAGDKFAAKEERRRTPERSLHFLEACGGFAGSFLAQHLFRHKIKKLSYQVAFVLIVLGHCGLAAMAYQSMRGTGQDQHSPAGSSPQDFVPGASAPKAGPAARQYAVHEMSTPS